LPPQFARTFAAPSFARAAAILSEAPAGRLRPSTDRRRFRRAPLALDGRILVRGIERDCRTMDLSPGGARMMAAANAPPIGERVVLYLDTIGRVPASVMRSSEDDGFGVLFEATAHKREKIAEQLTWLINKDTLGLGEDIDERAPRRDPAKAVTVTLEDGRAMHCEVQDFSIVGASLRTAQKRPDIGAWVRIGMTYGRVSRYLEEGFAVDFQAIQPRRG
jgi:hypothetical protein